MAGKCHRAEWEGWAGLGGKWTSETLRCAFFESRKKQDPGDAGGSTAYRVIHVLRPMLLCFRPGGKLETRPGMEVGFPCVDEREVRFWTCEELC